MFERAKETESMTTLHDKVSLRLACWKSSAWTMLVIAVVTPVDCCRASLPKMVSIPMTRDIRSRRMQSISIYFYRFDSPFIASVLVGCI
jgi:hypothetical protein